MHFPRPKVLQYRLTRSKLNLSKKILLDETLPTAPQTVSDICRDICAIADEEISTSLEKWLGILEESSTSEHRMAQFQRALYIVEWLEHEWEWNYGQQIRAEII